jgi:predicted kinase
VGIIDTPDWTTDDVDTAGRGEGKLADARLRQRLAALSDKHPSGTGYLDAGGNSEADQRENTVDVYAVIADARRAGLATDHQHTTDGRRRIWSAERTELHKQILAEIYASSDHVACEGKAILAGGLPGAGKTTVLRTQAGIDLRSFFMINPDDVKELMAIRGMIPYVAGLSPMQASDLAHEESSYLAKQLAKRGCADGRNVIWDITMASTDSTRTRIAELRAASYDEIEGIFVDIPVDVSVRRAEARHIEGQSEYHAGRGQGGRFVAPEGIRAQADPQFGSANRRTFEAVKSTLDSWRLYDNSVDGRPAVLIDRGRRNSPW